MGSKCRGALLAVGLCLAMACSAKDNSTQSSNESVSGQVTPQSGGSVALKDGAGVQVPPGGVAEAKTIQIAEEPAAMLAAEFPTTAGQPYAFTPHNTTFSLPVTVTLPAAPGATRVLRLDNEQDTTWEVVAGVTFANGLATFQTNHFCVYLVDRGNGEITGHPAATGGASGSGGAASGAAGAGNTTSGVSGASTGGGGGATQSGTGGGSTATGGTASGGTASGGSTASGGTAGSTASGGTAGSTAGGGSTGTIKTQFCGAVSDVPQSTCYTSGMAQCSASISACCADAGCPFALNCTLAGNTGETACISDAGTNGRALYQAAKTCLVTNATGCPFPPQG